MKVLDCKGKEIELGARVRLKDGTSGYVSVRGCSTVAGWLDLGAIPGVRNRRIYTRHVGGLGRLTCLFTDLELIPAAKNGEAA